MTETISVIKFDKPNILNLSPTNSISKDGGGPSGSVHPAPLTDEESPSVVHGREDPYRLRNALKTDAELAELRNRKKIGKQIENYHRDQNELIGQLLKPLEEHTADAREAEEQAKLPVKIAIYGSFIANLALCVLQIYATATSGSLSILAAGIDSFFDIGANFILGWFHRKSTRLDHSKWPAGGSRMETVGNITFGSIMAAINLVVVVECVRNMISAHEPLEFKIVPLINVAATLAVKLGLFFYCFALRNSSSQVRMLWEDHRNDLFVNGFALLMYAGGAKLAWWLDPSGGLIIAVGIIGSWLHTLYKEFGYLAGRSAPHEFIQLVIYKAATFSEEIQKVDTVRAYHSGPNYFVEVDIVMPGDTPLWKAHDLSQQMQDKLETLPGVERAFVHVDHETTHRPEHRKHV
ncbi:hypothetical protein FRC04_012187 [Tulasnella sp. 424]|nr:hypothetical protein FRC04_012187 [Tulasnella sp. 424]KAG8970956.1 hypothetical protein FRC05_011630 [Tulasnella sp. 425]